MTNSRTSKSIKNAKVALIFYFAQLVLGFFSRKAFFDYLGSEFLGLNTTASNLLGFLNLAELGVSAAICYFLYQPLYEKDYDKLMAFYDHGYEMMKRELPRLKAYLEK